MNFAPGFTAHIRTVVEKRRSATRVATDNGRRALKGSGRVDLSKYADQLALTMTEELIAVKHEQRVTEFGSIAIRS